MPGQRHLMRAGCFATVPAFLGLIILICSRLSGLPTVLVMALILICLISEAVFRWQRARARDYQHGQ